MEWNQDAIDAAKMALETVEMAVEAIATKATHLESLLTLLAHAVGSEQLPTHHRENVYWLGCELAADIRAAALRIG